MLRVLHNLSFIDDPTRIFRGIRYEARYGLPLRRAHGAARARAASRWASSATSPRRACATSSSPCSRTPARRAGSRRLGRARRRPGDSSASAGRRRRCGALRARAGAARELHVEVPAWRLGIAALARDMTSDEVYDWLERLKVRRRDVDRIVGAVTVAPRIVERLRGETLDPAEVVALADRVRARRAARSRSRGRSSPRCASTSRGCATSGSRSAARTSSAMGLAESPRVGEVLAELRQRKLNGELDGRDAELAAARELVAASAARERSRRRPRSASAIGRIRDEVGRAITIVVATKYVSAQDMAALAEAGVEVVGENRAQDLQREARGVRRRVPLALHRPPAVEQGQGRERRLRARALALVRLGRAAARDSGAPRGQPLGRGVRSPASRPRRSPATSSATRSSVA